MEPFKKHFTIEEARALLPQLRERFASMHKHKAALEQAEEIVAKELERTGGDVGGKPVRQLLRSMTEMHTELMRVLAMGIEVKDIDRGLIDFPALRDGREVFLCWELEEDDIEFWHDIEAGYAGRERL